MSEKRTLVIGTTADYIELIRRRFPGRALFLTDAAERRKAAEPQPDERSEALCNLTQPEQALAALRQHLDRWDIVPAGITCFDCESMPLAAHIARSLALHYPSPEAIAACRSKFACKQAWHRAGLPCPEIELVRTADDAARFIERIRRPAILKPLTGSGSELLFLCANKNDCTAAFHTIKTRLAQHPDTRMYATGDTTNPREVFALEEFISGTEYSCDFIIDGTRVEIIRIARKIPARQHSVGTTLAYVLPAQLPPAIDHERLRRQLGEAARTLGVGRAICMIDVMIEGKRPAMIEIAPRPGGDCLPPLILKSCGLDMLGTALDFAEGRHVTVPEPSRWKPLVGLRLFADRPGIIRKIDDAELRADPRVLESYLKRGPGHHVVLPPEDYDSRLLGHVIFEPSDPSDLSDLSDPSDLSDLSDLSDIEAQCIALRAKLRPEIEPPK